MSASWRCGRVLGGVALALTAAVVAGCGLWTDAEGEPEGVAVPVTAGEVDGPVLEHASALDGQRAPAEAGWRRRRLGGRPVLRAGGDGEPLAVELTGLDPGRDHVVLVGYALPLAAGETDGWGVRAAVGGAAEGGQDLARLDHTHRRHQPDPANPWVFEAAVGRARPDVDGKLEAVVGALDAGETAVASVRALPASVLDQLPARRDRELGRGASAVSDTAREDFPAPDDYMRVLQRWPAYAQGGFTHGYRGHEDLGYFGGGEADEQGMRPLGNFVYTYALLAGDERYDPSVSGISRAQLSRDARQALRYMARTHTTGDLVATNGKAWGGQWQSAWWTSRLAGGAMLLWERLSADEQSMVQRVVVAEADHQVAGTSPSGAALDSKAEENAWNTEVLAWALALFPDHPRAPAWRQSLDERAMNALSAPADRYEDRVVAGQPVRAWNETTNLRHDFTIANHGAYHPDYMAFSLQSLAWGAYALAAVGEPVPETLVHHHRDVWNQLAATYLGDGQFLYPAGKDWPHRAYGLDAVLPATVLRQWLDGDRLARTVEADRVRVLEWEQRLRGDGGFFSGRFTGGALTRWNAEFDSDTAASVGMAYHLGEVLGDGGPLPGGETGAGARPEPLSEATVAARLGGRLASPSAAFTTTRRDGFLTAFGWQTLSCCFGMVSAHHDVAGVVLSGDPSMAAWAEGQLAGSFSLAGAAEPPLGVRWHDRERLRGGGYATLGVRWVGGSAQAPGVDQQLAMVSLPRLGRALVLDQPVARRRLRLAASSGLDLHIANDVFNGLQRRVVSGSRDIPVAAGLADRELGLPQPWANVDGELGVAYDGTAGALELRTRSGRNLAWDSLRSETLRWRPAERQRPYAAGDVIRRLAFGFHPGGPERTRQLSEAMGVLDTGGTDVAAAWIQGETRGEAVTVLVAANFSGQPRQVALDVGSVPGARPSDGQRELAARSVEVWRP